MTRSEKAAFDKQVNEAMKVISQVIAIVAGRMASHYEVEIYNRLRDHCDKEIAAIAKSDELSAQYISQKIVELIQGGSND